MYAIDFEYDGKLLSDYGFIICDFNSSSGFNIASAGATITFTKVSKNKGKKYSLTSTQFDECITTTFHICKNPDIYDLEDMEISPYEFRTLMRWLNRREYLKFKVYDEDIDRERTIYYDASFNIGKVKLNEILYGLELTLETDRPFGYGTEKIYNLSFPTAQTTYTIIDESDDVGTTYPSLKITCKANGDLSIKNKFNGVETSVKNCKTGEIITLDNESQIITSSLSAHDLSDDFNYEFFRIGNTYESNENQISVSIPCEIELRYKPIIKDTP